MPSKPPASLLLDWITAAWALTPTTEPVAAGVLWRDNGVLTYSVGIPPVITSQPQSTSVTPGSTASFTITANNATGYQWLLNGSPIFGATEPNYETAIQAVENTGDEITCEVTGPGGSITSNVATITVELPALPSGAIGAWYADEYVSANREVIPNSLSASPVSPNLYTGSRRLFSNTLFWSIFNSTAKADDAVTGPDGKTQGSTFSATGNWRVFPVVAATLPAGTYTLAVNAKRNTGTDQVFAFTATNTSTRSSVQTATSSWQRFTYTFTTAGVSLATVGICSSDGSTAVDLQICDLELFNGSSDLGPSVYGGHLYLGSSKYSNVPTVASGEIDVSTGGVRGLIQLEDPITVTSSGVTFVCVQKKNVASSGYETSVSRVQGYTVFTPSAAVTNAPRAWINADTTFDAAGLFERYQQGYHTIAHRYNGTETSVWIDGVKLFRVASTVSSFTIQDLHVGILTSLSYPSSEKLACFALWNRALSDAEIIEAENSLVARLNVSGYSVPSLRFYCAEGDSISAAGSGWVTIYGGNATPKVVGNNFAYTGSMISHLVSRAATVDSVIPSDTRGRKFILSVLIGANDLTEANTATWLTSLASYLDARRAAGWLVALCTITPRSSTTLNNARNVVNPVLRTWVGTHCDAIIDFAADATMGTDAAGSDTLLYSDGTHPTVLGQQNLEAIARPVLDAM